MIFSVIIPVYNVEKYLIECIESVLNQSFDSFEIILVDDGSTDRSGEICDEYSKKYPSRIKVIHKDNQGQMSARCIGLKEAHGEYICFVDADDSIEQTLLHDANEIVEQYGADIIQYSLYTTDENGKVISEENSIFPNGNIEKELYFVQMLSSASLNSLCLKICRSSLFDVDTDYSEYYYIQNGEDLLQSIPIIRNVKSVFYMNRAYYYYRRNNSSITYTYQKERYKMLDVVRPKLYECMVDLGYDTECNVKAFFKKYLEIVFNELYLFCINSEFDTSFFSTVFTYEYVQRAREYLFLVDKTKRTVLKLFFSEKWKVTYTLLRIMNLVLRCKQRIRA